MDNRIFISTMVDIFGKQRSSCISLFTSVDLVDVVRRTAPPLITQGTGEMQPYSQPWRLFRLILADICYTFVLIEPVYIRCGEETMYSVSCATLYMNTSGEMES